MQCRKDTYKVICKTMGPDLNRGLCSMLQEDHKTARGICIYKRDDEYIIVTASNQIPPNCDEVQRITSDNVTIAVTGDLAFFATMLGKPSMDSKWCFLCRLGFTEWSRVNKVHGILWTRQALIDKCNAIQANTNMKASDKEGVKFIAILDVDPSLFIVSSTERSLKMLATATSLGANRALNIFQ